MRRRHGSGFLAAALLLWLLSAGCGGDPMECPWNGLGGRIEGRVVLGAADLEDSRTTVRAYDGDSDFQTDVRADGSYSLDVPDGDYVLRLDSNLMSDGYYYAAAGPAWHSSLRDTLHVDAAASPVRADFLLGSLHITVDLDPDYDGRSCSLRLVHHDTLTIGHYTYVDEVSTHVDCENGRAEFRLDGIRPGLWRGRVFMDGTNGGESAWLPGTRLAEEAAWYAVAVDSVTHASVDLASGAAHLTGRILGSWPTLGSGASPEVALFDANGNQVQQWRTVDPDGSYRFIQSLPGDVKVAVLSKGLRQWVGGANFADAATIVLGAGETATAPDHGSGALGLEVGWADQTLEWSSLVLTSAVDGSSLGRSSGFLLRRPYAWLPALAPGDYHAALVPDGSDYGSAAYLPADLGVVSIQADGMTLIPVTLDPGLRIRGEVAYPVGGNPVVVVTSNDDDVILYRRNYFRADATVFDFRALPAGSYKVGAKLGNPGFIGEPVADGVLWYPAAATWEDAGVLNGGSGDVLSGIDFDLR
ncbi:MAG TPA: hypothetical protein P5571_12960 [Candidatus Krumholzibacteria bacterium]|nr:hypothetical protein [Candidatus Krumholzibacteria bacterium]